ncbi:MAG: hypothetical protein KDA62_01175 [Planctomycetales bacterium]|nr:hypothetical protein [Planctomycetales bacterium]
MVQSSGPSPAKRIAAISGVSRYSTQAAGFNSRESVCAAMGEAADSWAWPVPVTLRLFSPTLRSRLPSETCDKPSLVD